MRGLLARLRAVFERARLRDESDEEVRFHLEMEIEHNLARGLSPADARRAARRAFGGVERFREETRDARGMVWLESLAQDLRYAVRGLRRHSSFAAAAILTLALGIGANGAVFSILQSALLQPLPYDDASRLVMLWHTGVGRMPGATTSRGNNRLPLTAPMAVRLHQGAAGQLGEVAAGIVTHGGKLDGLSGDNLESALDLTAGDRTLRLNAALVTPNFFRVLGVRAAIGGVFVEADDRTTEGTIVLSDATWRRNFGADPDIVGRPITVASGLPLDRVVRTFTVAGVLPRGVHFTYPDEVEAWLVMPWATIDHGNPYAIQYSAIARLRPGLSVEQARSLVATIPLDQASEPSDPLIERPRFGLTPMHDWVVGDTRPSLYLLGGVAALLLLVTCVTVANGLLARISERQQELAMRSALGAARSRVLQQLLIEGTLLVMGGVLTGIVLSVLVQPILTTLLPASLPQVGELRVNGSIVAFAAVMTAVTTILAAVAPAWGGTRQDASANLTRAASAATATRSSVRWRHVLVGAQAALTTMLLVFSALLLTSLWHLGRVPLGFDPHDVLAVDLQLLDAKYRESGAMIRFQDDLLRGVRGIPGISAAGLTSAIPFRGFDSPAQLVLPRSERKEIVRIRWVDSGFFTVLHVPIVRGRLLNEADREGSAPVAVISESYARAFGDENPIGQTIQLANPTQVVGVVGDLRYAGLDKDPPPAIYLPRMQLARPLITLIVRLDPLTNRAGAIDAIRRTLHIIDPGLPALHVAMEDQVVDATIAGRRFYTVATGAFAVIALLLTTVGLALVVARAVAERRRELAIRAALGATLTTLARTTVGAAMTAIGSGVMIGLLLAGGVSILLTEFLFEVAPRSPAIYAVAALLVVGVAIGAAWLPMQRFATASLSQMLRPD